MPNSEVRFVDVSNAAPREQDHWPAVVIPKSRIDAEIGRLCDMPRPDGGQRSSMIVHPKATAPGLGLAPGIDVTINVLLPGEESVPQRRNSSLIDMCIGGTGSVAIGKTRMNVETFDVWNTPSMETFRIRNDGTEPLVRLSYSNAPLLEKLEVHHVEIDPAELTSGEAAVIAEEQEKARRARDFAQRVELTEDGAALLGYEYLIDIDVIESKALLWRWKQVSEHLGKVHGIGKGYTGRRLYVLYNPATERRIGTSHAFFATIASVPPGMVDIPHRHTSAAINYYFQGNGRSTVMGEKFEWEAGDLMLSAPGWAVHNHASRDQGFHALTIQDHPLHIALDSLLWQETLKQPIRKLGSESGFQTNLSTVTSAG